MKTSAFLATCGAVLAAASPVLQNRRLHTQTDVVVEWVTVTVTEGDTSTVFRRPVHTEAPTTTTVVVVPSTTSVAPPPPTSTSTPPVVVAPQPTPETSSQAPAPVVQSPQPQVQAAAVSSAAPAPAAPSSSSSTQAAAAQPTDYQSTALYHHNVHRYNHSANALAWSDDLASSATVLAQRCTFQHDTTINGGGYGQNLAMWGSSADPEAFGATPSMARAATDGWYNGELGKFPSDGYGEATPDMTNFEDWGHYSQLVWKDTESVGCASVFCQPGTLASVGSWFTVCNYSPPGNVGGAYGTNVGRPEGQAVVTAP